MLNWWEAPEWQDRKPMAFARRPVATARVLDDTDPHLSPNKQGQMVLRLTRPHPQRPKVSVIRGSNRVIWCGGR